jgi:hypothetical protein
MRESEESADKTQSKRNGKVGMALTLIRRLVASNGMLRRQSCYYRREFSTFRIWIPRIVEMLSLPCDSDGNSDDDSDHDQL